VLCFPSADVADGDVAALTRDSPLDGYVAFDPERVEVELVDDRGSITRFPNWGDAADLIEILDVRPDGDGRFDTVVRGWSARRPVVEGSQMLGQAVVACMRHAPGRRVVSAHMVFVRVADARRPLRVELEEVSHGRTFTTLLVRVLQDARSCATGTFLLDATAPDAVRHEGAPPGSAAAGPDAAVPFDMGVTGRELRFVDAAYTGDPDAPAGPPVIDAWVRFRSVPDDAAVHAALLAQFSGHIAIAASLRPHAGVGQDQSHRTLSTAINAIAISFHGDVRADRWMLYHHESTFAGDGMTHAACRVHDEDGRLLASFSVDAMVRAFRADSAPADERTSL
jgi:acyl-CoA thioesterase